MTEARATELFSTTSTLTAIVDCPSANPKAQPHFVFAFNYYYDLVRERFQYTGNPNDLEAFFCYLNEIDAIVVALSNTDRINRLRDAAWQRGQRYSLPFSVPAGAYIHRRGN